MKTGYRFSTVTVGTSVKALMKSSSSIAPALSLETSHKNIEMNEKPVDLNKIVCVRPQKQQHDVRGCSGCSQRAPLAIMSIVSHISPGPLQGHAPKSR